MTSPRTRQPSSTPSGLLSIVVIASFSGFAGLGYEIVWTRLLANAFGHEIVAVLGVLAALFGGLALGSLVLGQRIAASPRPGLWYAGLEFAIGVWTLVLIPLLPALVDWVPLLTPIDAAPLRHWAVAFAMPFIVLLPATLAMGATLPALDAVLAPRLQEGHAVGWVYAANTFGAVIGTLASTFWIIPFLGLSHTLATLALVNMICALAMTVFGGTAVQPVVHARLAVHDRSPRRAERLAALFLTGLLGIGYEVVAVRTVSQILENTVYTFAALLSVYLLGTAVGAALYERLARPGETKTTTAWLAAAVSLCCAGGTVALGYVDVLQPAFRGLTGDSMTGAIGMELMIAAVVFLLPTIAMGALFTHLAQASRDIDGSMGPALAANTAGAALAPLLFGPLLLPLLGAKLVLVLIAVGYALAAPSLGWRQLAPRVVAAAAALVLLLTPLSLRFIQVPPGGTILWHRDGIMAAVSVVRDRIGDHHLEVNNRFRMGGTASVRSDYREADIPLLLHPAPHRALFLGLGTGATISAAGDYPGLVVDGVELVPEVVEAFPLFTKAAPNIGHNPNLHIHTADARRYVRAATERYDVIIADVYHPWIDGAGSLYTSEHFAAVRARLAEGGIFCQWLPLHQLDLPTLRLIVRTFLGEFPHASAYLAQFSVGTPLIGLVGTSSPASYPAHWLTRRVAEDKLRARLTAVDLPDEMALFGLFLADADDLTQFAGDGPRNSDDRPIVTYNAPRTAYVAAETPGDRLLTLLAALHPRPQSILVGSDGATEHRLENYWQARNRYLELGVRTAQSTTMRDVIAELAPNLIDLVRTSADFDSAYRPVLAMAQQLARSNPAAARHLLEELDRASPARSEARRLLAALPSTD